MSLEEVSDVRDWGGQAIRVWDRDVNRPVDILLCDASVCTVCLGTAVDLRGTLLGEQLTEGTKLEDSPFHSLPFVHMGKNTKISSSGKLRYDQAELSGIPEVSVPAETTETTVWFKRTGEWEEVKVLGCVPHSCKFCTPGEARKRKRVD